MKYIVVDTNYFINYAEELRQLSQNNKLICTYNVISEIKDNNTAQKVSTLFPSLEKRTPDAANVRRVARFAKKTGDFVSLSSVDMELIGLAVELMKEKKKTKYLRKEPMKFENKKGGKKTKEESLGWGYDWASDDESGWVGEDNIDQMKQETSDKDKFEQIEVGILTEDFAMQNIILQMGVPLLNIDGKIIEKVKSYVLECFSCWKISRKTDLVFCKSCGKDTLLKVTCEFKESGEFILYRKKNKQIKVRGARFPIPQPKGGRDIKNELLLNEDDFNKPKVRAHLKTMNAKKKLEDARIGTGFDMGLGFDDITSSNFKYKMVDIGYGKRNPNTNGFWKNKRKK